MAVQDAPNPIVHRVSLNPGNETRKAKTRLDEIFEEREEMAAKRYSAAELEKMAIEAENETARLRGEPPKYKHYGGETVDEEKKKEDEEKLAKQREQLTNSARALLDSGMEPKQVGQMLLGLPSAGGAVTMPAQGMGFEEVMKLVTFVVGKREADELKGIIASLDKKIEELSKNPPRREETRQLDPMTFAKQQAETLKIYHSTLDDLGMIPKQGPVTSSGEPIEIVKEKNRHAEKMEEIKADKEYKTNITEIAAEIPERIGRGIAGQLSESEEEEEEHHSNGSGLEHIICATEDCETKIYITPQTGSQVECPKCGAIYQRKSRVETEA